MGILKLKYASTVDKDAVGFSLPTTEYDRFNSSTLDLGDISKDGEYFEALASIFDLEGFTAFCTQIDPHLVIPEFLSTFLDWLFKTISKEFIQKQNGDQIVLWGQLPFFSKFMGDGVLFLWDTRGMGPVDIGNIVASLESICSGYIKTFLPQIKTSYARPPLKLRCGIARGQIISVGDGRDFVGPCINVASRLQKLGQFSFAFSKRGFNPEKIFSDEFAGSITLIKSQIRGVGEEELVFVLKEEFDTLSESEQKQLLP